MTLTNSSVSDVHPGTGTLSAITPTGVDIAPGATQVFTSTYVITQADFDDGNDIRNVATFNTTPARGAIGVVRDVEIVALVAQDPQVTLTKTASDDTDLTEGCLLYTSPSPRDRG